ncbi:MAG TPA: hypothetical protein VLA41_12545 [Burkholderiales bacterium]|nr:hypothetical protein [Burkholderiales bacterium]
MKLIGGICGALLLALFMGAVTVKLNEPALWMVAGIGYCLMLADIVQSVRAKD